ncbi:glycosyltransferase family 2 protein [Halomonas stenophila]|uniref:Glycosyltransferase 2-like domain-containing protein n=1 Tax=Halomonas stenophila TaxID=795312 RepID=A0A7W5HK69_9GAMM|nr:glycosyltransferase family A protein [Halomonas stenophila]MBB3230171.1 hypothetical protein [Halomonas stenophila]
MKIIPGGMLKRWVGHVRRFLPLWPSHGERGQLRLIRQHGMFQPHFYLAQLPAWRRLLAWRPALHFLRSGWRLGYAPDPRFATEWYLDRYDDVRQTRSNPLVHFLRHGVHEGRRPSPEGVLSDLPFLRGTALWYHRQLWQGHAHAALPRLRALAEAGDGKAYWYLAGWAYGHGRYRQALGLLGHGRALAASPFAPYVAQARVKCLSRLGDEEGVLAEMTAGHLGDDPLTEALVEASLVSRPAVRRLEALNRLYQRHKLARLRIRRGAAFELASLETRRVAAKPRREMPLVSVVVPAFNAEATLNMALDSLLAQSWPHLEIIVVDDASGDGTAELVAQRARYEPRLSLLRHERNCGAYAARNTGMRAARGPYVTVHDSDDWSHPQKIERQVTELMNSREAKGAVSFWVRADSQLRIVGPWHLCGDWLEINPSSLMVSREVLDELGLWDPVRVAADNEFVDRLMCRYGKQALLRVCPQLPLAFSLVQPDSLTQHSATHVRTVQHGVRQLYHQAARWWHGRQVVPTLDVEHRRRAFPAPLGNLPQASSAFDVAVLADLSPRNPALFPLLERVLRLRQAGQTVVLCPWTRPDDFATRQVAGEVWELCHEEDLAIAHADVALTSRRLLVQSLGEPESWPDRVPQLRVEGQMSRLDEQALPKGLADVLRHYLTQGGREVEASHDDEA